jgi:hypothetical protein
MRNRKIKTAIVAALALSLTGYAASASPATRAEPAAATSKSTFTLIAKGHSAGHVGARGGFRGRAAGFHRGRGYWRGGRWYGGYGGYACVFPFAPPFCYY